MVLLLLKKKKTKRIAIITKSYCSKMKGTQYLIDSI